MGTRILWLALRSSSSPLRRQLVTQHDVLTVQSLPEALLFLRTSSCDAVVVSYVDPNPDLDDIVLEIHRVHADVPVIVECTPATLTDAVRLAKLGVQDVWAPATTLNEAAASLRTAVEQARKVQTGANSAVEAWRSAVVGESEPMHRILDVIRLVAGRRSTVLITGETGTGKEVVARAIHVAGGRGCLPFVAVNCAAIPENLMESELFGYSKGAFTGASQNRAGKFEQANGGTLFLDEIGELSPAMQVKLLRVLQDREVQRLGSSETIRLNIRVVAATNLDLEEAVRAKRFREDLFYRLNVIPLHLPALRERLSDVPLLTWHFIQKVCQAERVPTKSISRDALAELCRFDWPGNIRQLEHAIEMAVVLSGDRPVLESSDFAVVRRQHRSLGNVPAPVVQVPDEGLDFEATVNNIERSMLQQALAKCSGNKARAADLLRMKRTTLLAKIKALEEQVGTVELPPASAAALVEHSYLAVAG